MYFTSTPEDEIKIKLWNLEEQPVKINRHCLIGEIRFSKIHSIMFVEKPRFETKAEERPITTIPMPLPMNRVQPTISEIDILPDSTFNRGLDVQSSLNAIHTTSPLVKNNKK